MGINSLENVTAVHQLPGLLLIKDLSKIYVNGSVQFEKLVGFKVGTCAGKTDFDIPSKASECASEFIKLDQMVIVQGINMASLDIQPYADGWHLLLGERIPLRNQKNEIIGLFVNAIDITNTLLFKSCVLLSQSDAKISNRLNKRSTYILDSQYLNISLTKRQYECLFFLVRGKSIKEIGKILRLSPRTVEEHIEKIKINLHCQTKNQVIEKAIDSGFIYYIPKQLFDQNQLSAV